MKKTPVTRDKSASRTSKASQSVPQAKTEEATTKPKNATADDKAGSRDLRSPVVRAEQKHQRILIVHLHNRKYRDQMPPSISPQEYAKALLGKGSLAFPLSTDVLFRTVDNFALMLPYLRAAGIRHIDGFTLCRSHIDISLPARPQSIVRLFDLVHDPVERAYKTADRKPHWWREPEHHYIARPYPSLRDTCDAGLKKEVPNWTVVADLLYFQFVRAALGLSRKRDNVELSTGLKSDRLWCRVTISFKERAGAEQKALMNLLDIKLTMLAAGGDVVAKPCDDLGYVLEAWLPYPKIYGEKSIPSLRRLIALTEDLERRGTQKWTIEAATCEGVPMFAARIASDVEVRPNGNGDLTFADREFLKTARKAARKMLRSDCELSSERLAGRLGLGYSRALQRRLKQLGLSYKKDIDIPVRCEIAAEMLLKGRPPKFVSNKTGYSDCSHFAKVFKAHFGKSLTAYAAAENASRRIVRQMQ